MAVGVEGVCKACLHALAREKWGILAGGGGLRLTDEEDNNGKQLRVYIGGRMRSAGFRCDLALRCGG